MKYLILILTFLFQVCLSEFLSGTQIEQNQLFIIITTSEYRVTLIIPLISILSPMRPITSICSFVSSIREWIF